MDWMRKRLDKIKIYHKELIENNRKNDSGMIDDITWNDLEMDEVFFRINRTKSFIGEQMLYHRLHDVGIEWDWEKFEEQIRYLAENEVLRTKMEKRLSAISKREEDYHLPTFLMHTELWKIESGIWLHILQVLLAVFLVGSIVLEQELWIAGLVIVAIINLLVYLKVKQQYEVFLFSIGSLKELIKFGKWMIDKDECGQFIDAEVRDAVEGLQSLEKRMLGWQSRKYASMTGDMTAMLQDYLMGITLIDVAMFNHIMKLIDNKQDKVLFLYELVGQMDMLLSIVSYRESVEVWCEPDICKHGKITVKGMVHPLLENSVANDFVLERRAIITGANASGKSTFMKAVAINAVLAQTIHTCTAEYFSMPMLYVMTSMALRDDILTGESYYIREVKYLKRMLNEKSESMTTLCVIDEILKGTNAKERLAASSAILRYLAGTEHMVLIATHDMELVQDMKECYEQYYFESQIVGKDICFDYHIKKGIGGKSNAIALLELLDFPKKIVDEAKQNMRGNWI
ncbi:MAG: hypothetical protein IKL06_08665 [Lachnospiraceae bacterium]|nr:hypothetical protein [Lachnospiraceae bacterium]